MQHPAVEREVPVLDHVNKDNVKALRDFHEGRYMTLSFGRLAQVADNLLSFSISRSSISFPGVVSTIPTLPRKYRWPTTTGDRELHLSLQRRHEQQMECCWAESHPHCKRSLVKCCPVCGHERRNLFAPGTHMDFKEFVYLRKQRWKNDMLRRKLGKAQYLRINGCVHLCLHQHHCTTLVCISNSV